jgi:hypothetical protein
MSTPVKIAWALFAAALIWIGAASSQGPTNCWDQYQTENEAILNCENHNDD